MRFQRLLLREVQGAEVSKSLVKSGAGVVLPRSAEPRTGKESERGRAVEKSVASSVTDSGLPVPWEISGARAAEVASGSDKPWCVPASACAQPSSFKGRRLALVQHLHRVRHRSGPAEVAQCEFGRLENHCRSQGPCWVMGRPASVV